MTRIIAGRAGGVRLDVPDRGTRPTSDRIRESLFGALASAGLLEGARVLDLYAGSGALGLEAASRGALSVDLVERAAPAARVVQRNIARVRKAGADRMRVHQSAAAAYLATARGPFDLVFADPPYNLGEDELARMLELLTASLAEDAVVVVERAARSPEPAWPEGWELLRDRAYGDTAVWWAGPGEER